MTHRHAKPDRVRGEQINLRVTAAERAELRAIARLRGTTMSHLIRDAARNVAETERTMPEAA